ncbi:MAG: hypothetical protein LBV78_23225, partial [Kitasatospora sp.]|nr:hypothetical protein [Kitasatospora sp.]
MSLESRDPGRDVPAPARRAARCAVTLLAAGVLLPVAGCSTSDESSPHGAYDVPGAGRAHLRHGGTVRWAVDA